MRCLLARSLVVLVAVVAAAARAGAPNGAERIHVYLVVVDGLGAEQLDPALMPHLFDATLDPIALRGESRAVMPTRTNPNHATLLTGFWPAGHGIVGNAYWDRVQPRPGRLDSADLLEAESIFTVAEGTRPELVTIAVFSKTKLGRMFDGAAGRQRAPDVLWVPSGADLGRHLFGVADDAETMDAFLARTADQEPDLAVVNLSSVDQAGHEYGPAATTEARRQADAAIARLVGDLRTRGRWERSVLIVTSDHGLDDVTATAGRDPSIVLSERFDAAGLRNLAVAGDGGVAHVYASPTLQGAARDTTLAWAAGVAWRQPGVSEVLALPPVPGVPALEVVHADWHLTHERTGDLLVVAADGYQLVDPPDSYTARFLGNHGGPAETRIPLIVAGGALEAKGAPLDPPPSSADVGATVAKLLGLRAPRRLDGAPAASGRPLALPLRRPR